MSATLVRPYSGLISAGETSGDRYGAELVWRFRELLGERISFIGVDGTRMAAAGVDLAADFTAHSVVASVGVWPHLASIDAAYRRLLGRIEERRPDQAILVDTPTFNPSFAARLERLRISAWIESIHPVGQPAARKSRRGRRQRLAHSGWRGSTARSRDSIRRFRGLQIGMDRIHALVKSTLTKKSQPLKIAILREDLYDALKHSAAAAGCSGTATLETALIGTPFVIV